MTGDAMDHRMIGLNLLYLLKARELVISGQELRAQLQLGLSPEAIPVLKRLSMFALAEVAQWDSIRISLLVPPPFWKALGQEEATGPLDEVQVAHRLAISILGEIHDEFTATA